MTPHLAVMGATPNGEQKTNPKSEVAHCSDCREQLGHTGADSDVYEWLFLSFFFLLHFPPKFLLAFPPSEQARST